MSAADVIALIDCENFYASCERVFDPSLRGRPVAVLSNNDGCIVARSSEVKAAGIPMGAPLFQWRAALDRIDAAVLSSNYPLYADMSQRVMRVLERAVMDLEVYSIDEAFATLPALPVDRLRRVARRMRQTVRRHVGVPVRVGIGPTKTLAKVANAKAKATDGVFVCPPEPALTEVLRATPAGDVWGIGRAHAKRLSARGVTDAAAFRALPDAWIRQHMAVTGLRTARELRGERCHAVDPPAPQRKTLIRSRSFGQRVYRQDVLAEALAHHTQRAAEKLRHEGLDAGGMQIFVTTKRFGPPPHYSNRAAQALPQPTSYTPVLVSTARRLLATVYRSTIAGERVGYKKCGVLLYALRPKRARQLGLFAADATGTAPAAPALRSQDALMRAVDALNARMGRGTVYIARTGRGHVREPDACAWAMAQHQRSPCYTTRWTDVPRAMARYVRGPAG
ncbi:Y-family DNA polymerase [Salisaeta longa]|uniref:Y-family DNA polymerase n=1 Tax=Salisaeta longa TaxID=503170 RepID=UPI0003B77F95|nr:Y-family DNA polymerase [Salisaeta longa]